ncbi:MAG: hypothetical protein NZP72_04175 [Geminicoccaceae bacterium]|nr:hypothetical protein [Geminicoccaceae bacterium]
MKSRASPDPWAELEVADFSHDATNRLALAFARCFRGADGALVLDHLRRCFLDRRLPPTASDAELRHVEGQRSVVAHILHLIQRGQGVCSVPSANRG